MKPVLYQEGSFSKIIPACKILLSAIFLLLLLMQASALAAQETSTQTIRGQVIDDVSKASLVGATVSIEGQSELATVTIADGSFVLHGVPVGRRTLYVSHVGYEDIVLPNILVTSGKEVLLTVPMTEKIAALKEVTVAAKGRRTATSEMSTVSKLSFNPIDTRRYAGAVGDPSRMITGMAGVASASDTRNDIVVRGNSPQGLLWQMEGVSIPNPNHYGSLSSTGGPVSMLNNNNLGPSSFYTGAFPAQYGNAVASAFDLTMRNGNSNKTELVGEMNFTGFELGAEGPFSKKSKASYIINYRYSTIGIMNSLGFNIGTGTATPQYQNVNFKVYVPLSPKNKLSFWGIGGPSKINFWGNEIDSTKKDNLYSNENENLLTKYFTAMTGATLETNFSNSTYGKLSAGYNYTYENVLHDSISPQSREAFHNWQTNTRTNRYVLAYLLAHKFNAKHSLATGINATLYNYKLLDQLVSDSVKVDRINQDVSTTLLQAYAQWKYRTSERLFFTVGVHSQLLTLNSAIAIEPRVGVQYSLSRSQTVSFGYGMQSQMQSPLVYFYQTNLPEGIAYTNKELGFTRSQHIVLGYTTRIAKSISIKTELYYQSLYDVPVTISSSGYSMLNDGASFVTTYKDSLVNKGTGKNYGIEVTLEKGFSNNYYFLVTGSLFNSTYKGSDGVTHNTAFNTRYVANVLAGKDFMVGKNRRKSVLSVNGRLTTMGGKYTSPVDVAASLLTDHTVYDETIAPFSIKQSPYFRADLKIGYRRNYQKATLEAGIDLQNITNHKNIFLQNYNVRTATVENQYQQGFLPVPYFRFTF